MRETPQSYSEIFHSVLPQFHITPVSEQCHFSSFVFMLGVWRPNPIWDSSALLHRCHMFIFPQERATANSDQ